MANRIFNREIQQIYLPVDRFRDANYYNNLMTFGEMQQKYPYINWLEYVRNLMPTTTPVYEHDVLTNKLPVYFEALGPILARTSNRTLSNYFMQRIVTSFSQALTQDIRSRLTKFWTESHIGPSERPLWEQCIEQTKAS